MNTWVALHPQWFLSEYESLKRRYPNFRVDEGLLHKGVVVFYGELVVRPPGGTKRQAVQLIFPSTTPYVFPTVVPIERMPEFDSDGKVTTPREVVFFDRLHQMPNGGLCLFQHPTRGTAGGEAIRAVDVLRRAEQWLIGHYTGHWPPDTHRSELELHFYRSGDILLGERLFDSDLTGYGEFFAVRDVMQQWINDTNDLPPLLVTAILDKSSGVAAVQDARQGLIPIFPWLANDFWKPEQLAELDEKQRTDNLWNVAVARGYWWTLTREPAPFRDGAGLLRELEAIAPAGDSWKMVSDALGPTFASETRHLFGLKYPGRDGRAAWLVLELEATPAQTAGGALILAANDREKRERFSRGQISCLNAHAVRPMDIQLRNETVVASDIGNRTVAMVGLGALGSKVAELLAQAGVGRFRLCDSDRLTIGNVARHIGGLHQFGSQKLRVVGSRLSEINSFLVIEEILPGAAHARPELFAKFCKGADIVISTIADEGAESALNQIAVTSGVTMLYGRAMRRGSMGRVFLVRPGQDACKSCLSKYANEPATGGPAGWINVEEPEDDAVLQECGRPVIPASAIDLSFVAALIARKALDVLERKDGANNHVVWTRDGASDVDQRLASPLSVVETAFRPLPECPVCQQPPVVSIELPAVIRAQIAALVEASPTAETGGVLIGYVENQKAIVTRATGPGPNATRTSVLMERDIEYVQQQLDLTSNDLGPKGVYVGEWHSHLAVDPAPSGQDIRSMIGIALAPNYATDCPVLVIAGLNVKDTKLTTLNAWSFPIEGQAHRIPIETPEAPCEVADEVDQPRSVLE